MINAFEPRTPHFDNHRKPVMLIIHGIGTSLEDAENIFTGNSPYEASTHYFITQTGEVRQYLDDLQRAYHAGASYWSGITDINSVSIGIELEGAPVITDANDFHLVRYTGTQMDALCSLIRELTAKYKIAAPHILGHQDIAPYRKYDPGPNFDWEYLAQHDIGLWHGLQKADDKIVTDQKVIDDFKHKLTAFGYDPRPAEGKDYAEVITAFQAHFLPWNICGQVTEQSVQALEILLRKKDDAGHSA